jgi:hypothetical protein
MPVVGVGRILETDQGGTNGYYVIYGSDSRPNALGPNRG